MWDTAVEGALRLEDANLVACGEFVSPAFMSRLRPVRRNYDDAASDRVE